MCKSGASAPQKPGADDGIGGEVLRARHRRRPRRGWRPAPLAASSTFVAAQARRCATSPPRRRRAVHRRRAPGCRGIPWGRPRHEDSHAGPARTAAPDMRARMAAQWRLQRSARCSSVACRNHLHGTARRPSASSAGAGLEAQFALAPFRASPTSSSSPCGRRRAARAAACRSDPAQAVLTGAGAVRHGVRQLDGRAPCGR